MSRDEDGQEEWQGDQLPFAEGNAVDEDAVRKESKTGDGTEKPYEVFQRTQTCEDGIVKRITPDYDKAGHEESGPGEESSRSSQEESSSEGRSSQEESGREEGRSEEETRREEESR